MSTPLSDSTTRVGPLAGLSATQRETAELAALVVAAWNHTLPDAIRSMEEERDELRAERCSVTNRSASYTQDEAVQIDRLFATEMRLSGRIGMTMIHRAAILRVADRLERIIARELLWEMQA